MPDELPKIPRFRGKKNQPVETKWRQQNLPAYRPIITAKFAIILFLFIGLLFILIGVLLHFAALSVFETSVDYTNCTNTDEITTSGFLPRTDLIQPVCNVNITLDDNYKGEIYFYYGLSNYYQNTRRYVKSRNEFQLVGDLQQVQDCEPLQYVNDSATIKIPYAPCGSVANSMFNDKFTLYYKGLNGTDDDILVPFTTNNVVGADATNTKYRNPPNTATHVDLCKAFENTAPPRNWSKRPCDLCTDENNASTCAFQNVDFIVWMNVAALPTFRKLYRTLDRRSEQFKDRLPAGVYNLLIEYNYPVAAFDGRKRFIIATHSWTGPRNTFLGYAYMSIGSVMILIAFFFIGVYIKFNCCVNKVA